jgi:hypothetical protein
MELAVRMEATSNLVLFDEYVDRVEVAEYRLIFDEVRFRRRKPFDKQLEGVVESTDVDDAELASSIAGWRWNRSARNNRTDKFIIGKSESGVAHAAYKMSRKRRIQT